MKKIGILLMAIVFMQTSFAQETATDKSTVKEYLAANGSLAQYDFAYTQLLKMLKDRYPKTDDNAQGWDYLNTNKAKAIADMEALLVDVYQTNFTTSDLKQMTAFYTTDTGQQLQNDRSKLTEIQKQELNSYYNTEVGQKVIEKQEILSKAIGSASENWSRDLYETAVSLLKPE